MKKKLITLFISAAFYSQYSLAGIPVTVIADVPTQLNQIQNFSQMLKDYAMMVDQLNQMKQQFSQMEKEYSAPPPHETHHFIHYATFKCCIKMSYGE